MPEETAAPSAVEPSPAAPAAPETSVEPAPAAAPAPAPAQAPVFDKILEHQTAMQRQLESLTAAQQPAPQAAAPAPEAQPTGDTLEAAARALLGGDPDDGYGPDPDGGLDPQALVGLIQRSTQEAATAAAQAALQPVQAQMQQERLVGAFDALEESLPRLAEQEVQSAVIQRAVDAAAQIGNPELLLDPGFIRLAYDAWAGQQQGAGEPTPPEPVGLESAGGASPGVEGEVDPAEAMGDAIVGAGSGGSFWGF